MRKALLASPAVGLDFHGAAQAAPITGSISARDVLERRLVLDEGSA